MEGLTLSFLRSRRNATSRALQSLSATALPLRGDGGGRDGGRREGRREGKHKRQLNSEQKLTKQWEEYIQGMNVTYTTSNFVKNAYS